MRLDKLLEQAECGSRRSVKKLLRSNQVSVDGRVATKSNQIVDSQLQDIYVSGVKIKVPGSRYYLLNKPAGVVTACRDTQYQTVIDLITPKDRVEGLYPVGRLDRDTEGLILVTNNGPLGYRMLHPKHHVSKKYFVRVNGYLDDDVVSFFASGVKFLDGTKCAPAHLSLGKSSFLSSEAEVTLSEGKCHQIKKMFLAYGVKVTYLKRVSFAGLALVGIPLGKYRKLSQKEQIILKQYFD